MVELANRRPRAPAESSEVPIVVTRTMDTADSSLIANAVLGQPTEPLSSETPVDGTEAGDGNPDQPKTPTPDLTATQPTPTASTPVPQQRPNFMVLPERKNFNFTSQPGATKLTAPESELGPEKTRVGNGNGSTVHGINETETLVLNVLIVDDDPLTRKLMSRLLTRLGCVCDTAENGLIALGTISIQLLSGDETNDFIEMLLGPVVGTPSSIDPPALTQSYCSAVNPHGLNVGKYAAVFLDNQCVPLVLKGVL